MPAGYDPEAAIQTMRHAVEAIPGARWISVEHHEYPLRNPRWLTVYLTPDTTERTQLTARVKAVARAALEPVPRRG
jgi:hypothetical protein